MDDEQEIADPEQYKALAHPLRHRLLFALGAEPATISQLAVTLGVAKGSVAHHLKVLHAAGLVRESATRQVRGGTERYYRRAGRKLTFSGPGADANAVVTLRAVVEEMATARDPYLSLRSIRLSPAQAEKLAERLDAVLSELDDAGPDEARHGVVFAVYRPNQG